jgi:hypothetical protein
MGKKEKKKKKKKKEKKTPWWQFMSSHWNCVFKHIPLILPQPHAFYGPLQS